MQVAWAGVRRELSEIEEICGPAIAGRGSLRAQIVFPGDDPIPGFSEVLVINVADGQGGASLRAVAAISQPISTYIVMGIESGLRRAATGPRLVVRVPEIANGAGSIDRLRLRFSRLMPGGEGGLVRLSCTGGETSIRSSASFADGSVLSVDNGRNCGPREGGRSRRLGLNWPAGQLR